MAKKTKISPDDIATFQKAVAGTKPLLQNKIRLAPRKTTRKPIQHRFVEEETVVVHPSQPLEPVRSEEFIAYKQASISDKTLRKLRKGQYNVEAILDLHGLSVDEAKKAVGSFLQQCLDRRIRVVLIIHGKGHHSPKPVLKNKLNHWLREVNVVLAFCSAAPSHGSRGAIYLLLRHKAEENLFE